MGWWHRNRETINRISKMKRFVSLFLVGLSLSVAIAACGGGASNSTSSSGGSASPVANTGNVELNLVSFAVTKAAHDEIIPKFVEQWQKEKNQNVTFNQSYLNC